MLKKLLTATLLIIGMVAFADKATLLGHWPMNEGSGDIIKDAGGKYNGKLCNAANTQWVEGREEGKALQFGGPNGKGAYLLIDKLPKDFFEKGFTISLWFKPDATAFKRNSIWYLASSGNGAKGILMGIHFQRLLLGGDGNHFSFYAASNYAKNPFKAGEWVHFTASYDGKTTYKVYINGALAGVSDAKTSKPMVHGGDYLVIGSQGGYAPAVGLISDLKLYTGVLTEAEILSETQEE